MSNNVVKYSKMKMAKIIGGMTLGSIIYCMAVVWVLDLGYFYASGITGISQLIVNAFGNKGIILSKSIFITIFNIPIFIIGWKGVSKRFALLSVSSVIIQVITVFVLEKLVGIGINPFAAAFTDSSGVIKESSMLTVAVLGGLICGVGSGISLKSGASTGGMDIVSQYFSLKKQIPFTIISLTVDLIIVAFAMLVGSVSTAVYTVIRLIITILVLDRMHTVYNFLKIQIITDNMEAMREALVTNFNHGVTIYKTMGGYSKNEKWVLETVVLGFEAEEYKNLAHQIDPNVFITFTTVKHIFGNYNRNVIT